MEGPLVSIIVPVYNAENHIVRCVESIRRQTYENIEILVLNDGSTDNSMHLCEMLARVDDRIVLVDKENSGVSGTRNLGMKLAKGKYLQFVDADDTVQPYATELLVQKAEEHQTDLVIAHYNRIQPLKEPQDAEEAAKKPAIRQIERVQTSGYLMEGYMDKESFAAHLMQEPASFYYGVMWNKLYRTDLVRAHEDVVCSEEMKWSEDLYFNLSYIRYAERFYALSTPIYNYYNNPGSAVHNMDPIATATTRLTLYNYYKDLYEHMGLYEEFKDLIFKFIFTVGK